MIAWKRFSDNDIKSAKDIYGAGWKDELRLRKCGTTTAFAFELIARAMLSPGTSFPIKDHVQFGTNREANRNLTKVIKGIIKKLNLEGFNFNTANNEMVFLLDEEFLNE